MYQDEAGFGRISKLGKAWAPEGVRPIVHSHHIREYRYCYGAVDARTGESFFLLNITIRLNNLFHLDNDETQKTS